MFAPSAPGTCCTLLYLYLHLYLCLYPITLYHIRCTPSLVMDLVTRQTRRGGGGGGDDDPRIVDRATRYVVRGRPCCVVICTF